MEESEFIKPKPGTVYKPELGKAYFFGSDEILVMRLWPPMAWRKTKENPYWMPFRPEIHLQTLNISRKIEDLNKGIEENGQLRLPFPLTPEEIKLRDFETARLKWLDTIPPEALKLAMKFKKRQWHILSFLARCGDAAYDLVISNPALAFALASNWVFHTPAVTQPLRSARALLKPKKKQKDILSWLGFPRTETCRKTSAKVIHATIDINPLLYLRQATNIPGLQKTMAHIPRYNGGVIRVVSDPNLIRFSKPSFLQEISHSRREDSNPKSAYILRDSIDMHRLIYAERRRFPLIRNVAGLEEIHDTLAQDTNKYLNSTNDFKFPDPPIQGSDSIVPIRTSFELIQESVTQKNCVSSYMEDVAIRKNTYIYRVLEPERCTLSIILRKNEWILSELKLSSNREPSRMTFKAVKEWLQENS